MARILISSLGTGALQANSESAREYRKTTYKFQQNGKDYTTSFVSTALCEHLQVDKLFLVGTSKSMWEEVYNYFATKSNQPFNYDYWADLGEKVSLFTLEKPKVKQNDLQEVAAAIDAYLKHIRESATGGSKCYIIDYGLNEEEIWRNFDVFMHIGESIAEDDEVYLDITHAFRSIPLFNYLMLDLISILKFKNNFRLAGLFYGMLEAAKDVGYAPIIDLTPLYNLTLWTRGAYNFINFGNGYQLAEVINDSIISGLIIKISDMVNLNYVKEFKTEVDRLENLLKQQQTNEHVLKYMQPYLDSFISSFKRVSSSSELQFALAKWYYENKRFSQAYICLAESIISKILEIYREKDARIRWSRTNSNKVRDLIINQFRHSDFSKIHEEYDIISKRRNNIAHAGFMDGDSYDFCIRDFDDRYNRVEQYVFKNKALKKIPELYPFNKLRAY